MKKQRNNKGFTLVELIVVMAIMAILVGALAPQVVKYVEKARESKDLQVVSTVFTAVQTAIATSESAVGDITDSNLTTVLAIGDLTTTDTSDDLGTAIKQLLGTNMNTQALIEGKLASKAGKAGDVYVTYNSSSGALSVRIALSTAPTVATLGPVTN